METYRKIKKYIEDIENNGNILKTMKYIQKYEDWEMEIYWSILKIDLKMKI